MAARYFDAHAHAHFPAYMGEVDEVLDRAHQAEVDLILVGTERGTSETAVSWANKRDNVWAAIGLHPTHTTQMEYVDPKELEDVGHAYEAEAFDSAWYTELARDSKVVAIGECGLDYYRLDPETKRVQQNVLIQHLEVAKEVDKPVTIHCRDAFDDLIGVFKDNRSLLRDIPGTIHFFTGTREHAQQLLDMGFYIQFGGVITFAKVYEDIVRYVPLDRIITETDAPYVAPIPYRGKRNEPAYVVEVVKKLAELKEVSIEEARERARHNAQAVFGI